MAASDEKDRYGDQLHHAAQARENQWAAERDNELLTKLRHQAEERAIYRQHAITPKVFSRILCPLDFDENSLKALDLAARLAAQSDAELYLLHVCSTVFVPLGGPITDRIAAERSAQRRMEEIAGQNLFNVSSHLFITTGDPAERVIAVQSGLDSDLIVMGTHGRRVLPRLFLGSVADRVIREAACPVLTVRQDTLRQDS